ncbi:Disease resistance protein [Quillaja saponaria]|uniref:Disease resistance protein n=1 Tax=Quillaja saponaria TaxID=32244 RepID=A0AAD7KVF5_QUISA|nr:Disease resistance protein [Quillaja saponaria]
MATTILVQGVAAPVVQEVVRHGLAESYSHIRAKISSSGKLDDNHELLCQDVKKLFALKDDNENEVQRHKQKVPTSSYSLWMNRVLEIVYEVEKLKSKYESKRLQRWRIQQRSRLSEGMVQKLNQIGKLIEEGQFPRGFLVDKRPERVLKVLDAPKIKGFPTLEGPVEDILRLLKNIRIKRIGVLGAVGVGKTTIMQNINNHEEVSKLFDIVILLEVSAEQREEKLQRAIAQRLQVNIEGVNDRAEVARRIHEDLLSKKYLLLLDDAMDSINLEKVGIPDNDNGSKVLFATKFRHVCKLNRASRLISVKLLSSDEAWKMFRDIVIDVINLPDIQPIARLVSNKCARLPLLIKAIAHSFKVKENAFSWRAGLKDLKIWPEIQNQGLREMYSFLRFCYDELKDEKKQKCFLYGSLYPADSKIFSDYLVECWAAEGFLGDLNDTRRYRDIRDCGYDILEHLTNVSLLEKGERMIYVRMNNCIRQLALHISSEDPECNFYVTSREDSSEFNNSVSLQQAKRISMIDHNKLCEISSEIQENPNKLLTLLLQKNYELAIITQTLFEYMSNLRVLDLYCTKIRNLPSSLSKLTCLRGLYLNDCVLLTELPSELGKLKLLEVLDIRGSRVTFIPLHIRSLINLRCLRITYMKSGDKVESQDVISKLHKLEELIIEVNSYKQWCNEAEDVMNQVSSLENLTTLRFCFPTPSTLRGFMEKSKSWRDHNQFTSFRFFVGFPNSKRPQILEYFDYKMTRFLKYCNGEHKDDLTISELLTQTEALELICHKDIKALSDFVSTTSLNSIRGCVIEGCNRISTIVDAIDTHHNMENGHNVDDNGTNRSILPSLEQLYIRNLLKLRCVFRGLMRTGTLSKLKILVLRNCPLLKRIFSNGAIRQFSELQKLKIQDCSEIEELIMKYEGVGTESYYMLPKLELLVLVNVPKLKIICQNDSLAWPSLEVLVIHDCPELKAFPFSKDNAANLRSIKGQQEWWNKLEWENDEVKERFQPIYTSSDEYFF